MNEEKFAKKILHSNIETFVIYVFFSDLEIRMIIDLVYNKLIYSLNFFELENLKTYIEINIVNSFI